MENRGFKIAFRIFYFIHLPNKEDYVWGIERSGFFNGQGKWAKGFENQMV